MEVAELVGNAGQCLGDRLAHGLLAIRDHAEDRHGECVADFPQQAGEVVLTSREHAARTQDLAAEAVAHDPEDLVPYIGLKPIQPQHDVALSCRDALQAFIAGKRKGQQFVVPIRRFVTVRSQMATPRSMSTARISGTLRCWL